MENTDLLHELRYLRGVVASTQPPTVNRYWPVTLSWGCVICLGYLVCVWLARTGRMDMLPWVWPLLLVGAAPVHGYLARKVRMSSLGEGVRPRFRRDLMLCWMSITVIAMLWTVGMVTSGLIQHNWQVLMFLWGSLYCVGYVINGVLLSREWLWVAGALLASLVAAFLAGPDLYWLPGFWIGGTLVMAGLMGRRNALRQSARTA